MKNFIKFITAAVFLLLFAVNSGWGQTTYTWNGGTTDYQIAGNWTPSRTTPATNDVLVFNTGAAQTVTNIPAAQTIGNLIITNNTTVNVTNSVATILTIGGTTSVPDFSIASGSTLGITSTTGAFTIQISTGATGTIDGNLSIGSTAGTIANRVLPTDAGSLVVNSGAVVTQGLFCSGSFFNNAGTANVVSFESGSTFVQKSGSNPFGLGAPNSRAQFKTGSLFRLEGNITPAFSGRTYPNFELNYAGIINVTGASAVSVDNLTITTGTLNFNMTGPTTGLHLINGNISVASGAALTFSPASASTVNVKGNITVAGSMAISPVVSQTVNLNGSSSQSIGNFSSTSSSTIVFSNSNGFSLNGDVTLGGTMTLTSGVISTGTRVLTLGTGTSALGTLLPAVPASTSYIAGNFERWFAAAIVSDVYFPVGTGTHYLPAIVSYTVAPSTGGKLKVTAFDNNPGADNTSNIDDGGYTIDRYSNNAWWQFTPATLSGGTYTLNLQGDGITGASAVNFIKLRIIKRVSGTQTWLLDGTHTDATGSNTAPTVKRTGLSGFSEFGIGGYSTDGNVLADIPLPAVLSSFTSCVSNRNVRLNWTTSAETNNSGFYVERINNEELIINNWKSVGYVKGAGNSNTATSYMFEDRNLNTGKYAYRLKQVDVNGNFEYFALNGEVEIGVPKKYDVSQNYPNPFNPITKINFDLPENGLVNIRLYDMLGREVAVIVNEVRNAGYHTVQFDGSKLSSGIYFYKMTAGKYNGIKKMAVIK